MKTHITNILFGTAIMAIATASLTCCSTKSSDTEKEKQQEYAELVYTAQKGVIDMLNTVFFANFYFESIGDSTEMAEIIDVYFNKTHYLYDDDSDNRLYYDTTSFTLFLPASTGVRSRFLHRHTKNRQPSATIYTPTSIWRLKPA